MNDHDCLINNLNRRLARHHVAFMQNIFPINFIKILNTLLLTVTFEIEILSKKIHGMKLKILKLILYFDQKNSSNPEVFVSKFFRLFVFS